MQAMLSRTFVQNSQGISSFAGETVVLSFVEQEPMIVDIVYSSLQSRSNPSTDTGFSRSNGNQVEVDGEKVTITATRSLILKCGGASIELDADGKISIRGERMVSKVRGAQVIRGASIKLN